MAQDRRPEVNNIFNIQLNFKYRFKRNIPFNSLQFHFECKTGFVDPRKKDNIFIQKLTNADF